MIMTFTKKKTEEKTDEPRNPPRIVKTDENCIIENCLNLKQAGQNSYCEKHVRAG